MLVCRKNRRKGRLTGRRFKKNSGLSSAARQNQLIAKKLLFKEGKNPILRTKRGSFFPNFNRVYNTICIINNLALSNVMPTGSSFFSSATGAAGGTGTLGNSW